MLKEKKRGAKLYKYFKGSSDMDFNIFSMKKYFETKQEIDKFLEKLISPFIKNKKLEILDACCGVGHLSYFLSKISPKSRFTGIDGERYLINEAKRLCKNKKNIKFESFNLYDLPQKYPKKFNITINWKTISWLPYYEDAIKALFAVTKNHIFLSSLFYDGDIDFEVKARELKKEAGKDGFNAFYNIYSLPRFKDFIYKLGMKNMEVWDFDINIDLPRQSVDKMGTYTLKLESGKRLQISGAILMLWKIIRIDL